MTNRSRTEKPDAAVPDDPRSAAGWQLEGNAAEAYERYLVPAFFAGWAERLVALAAPRPGERVLDVGCGTGIVARTAAAGIGPSGTAVGVDLNPGMLEVARAASAGIRPAIDWRLGDAAGLPFADGAFDVVLSQQALQFFTDRTAALREMRRVLARSGRLGLNVLRPIAFSTVYEPLADALARHVGPAAGAMMRSPFPSSGREALRAEVKAAGFADVRILIDVATVRYPSAGELLRREAASSPLAGPIGALDPDVRAALVAGLEKTLADHADDDGIVFPMESFLVLAR